eukprot:Anaeramoba_ignava/c18862_g1_i2.p1 GENE.c18862_g1_i2~~c18862_g1_i2.p1  ORF type:complete len:914 (+),score=263.88 c18862_g1_i2:328-2742(+)
MKEINDIPIPTLRPEFEQLARYFIKKKYYIPTNETKKKIFHCKLITIYTDSIVKLIFTDKGIHLFIKKLMKKEGEFSLDLFKKVARNHFKIGYQEIEQIHRIKYLLKDIAVEIFLTSGRTMFFAFENREKREEIIEEIFKNTLENYFDYEQEYSVSKIQKLWIKDKMSNFEYLMHLNTLAGRSANDLAQYPVFPNVIADYNSEVLDITNESTFRNVSKPMGALDHERMQRFVSKYNDLKETGTMPFHYGTHYSNIGSVLGFLVRLEPFASLLIDFQSGQFDLPDRLFDSMERNWKMSSSLSNVDIKELIPEFFYLPDCLTNLNGFDFGKKQNGVRVDDVVLPKWANNDPRLFVHKQLMALESNYISINLNKWIDLIFGFKQRGQAAVDSVNVFHPYTYQGITDFESIQDENERQSVTKMLKNFGQTPKQLFKSPHQSKNKFKKIQKEMERKLANSRLQNKSEEIEDADQIETPINQSFNESDEKVNENSNSDKSFELKKSTQETKYQLPKRVMYQNPSSYRNFGFKIGQLFLLGNRIIGLRQNRAVLYPMKTIYSTWKNEDQTMRIYSLDEDLVFLTDSPFDDYVNCCDCATKEKIIVTGGSKCFLSIWKMITSENKFINMYAKSILYGHTDQVLCVVCSSDFHIIVSGSADKTAIIWDLNDFSCLSKLEGHEGSVSTIAINKINGDVLTFDSCSNSQRKVNSLTLWAISGRLIKKVELDDQEFVRSAIFTNGNVGVYQNVLLTGMNSGKIFVWDSFDLSFVCCLKIIHNSPVTALFVTDSLENMYSGDENGNCFQWSLLKDLK